MTINEKIKAYLSQNGLTAEKVGLSPEQLTPGAEIDAISYYNACKVLKVSLDYFMEGEQ